VFRQKSADVYQDLGPVMTQPGAKTLTFDPRTKRLFLPAAEVEVVPAPDGSSRTQRKIRPGSFGVLVVQPLGL
jgi:hypothetical protein